MSDRLALELALRRAPGSVPRRLILADFLEEQGERHAADAHRWLAAWGKRPWRVSRGSSYFWSLQMAGVTHSPAYARLPRPLVLALTAPYAPRRFLAEAAVVDAWPRALAAGWVPEWPGGLLLVRGAPALRPGLLELPADAASFDYSGPPAEVHGTLTYYDPVIAASLAPPPA